MATLIEQATALLELCRRKKLRIATAESCTGGLIAATLTEIPGSSDVVDRGFVTYSNAAKQAMLGVPCRDARSIRRGQPRDRRSDGGRRPGEFTGRARGFGHGHCRPRRRLARQAGRARAFCRGFAGAAD